MADGAAPPLPTRNRRLARTMAIGWAIHFKQESRNPFYLWILVCTPLIYSTMAYFLFRG